MSDNIVNFGRARHGEGLRDWVPDDHDLYGDDDGPGHSGGRSLGDLLEVVVIADQVVDVRRRPVDGTGYECAALELGRGRPVVRTPARPPEPPQHEKVLSWLGLLVGGEGQLLDLEPTTLPDEQVQVDGLSEQARDTIRRVDAELTRVTELLLGSEIRTAARRLVVRAVTAQPTLLRSTASEEVVACAALTAVARANDLVGSGRIVPASLLRTMFNLRSSPNDKVQALTRAVAPETAFLDGWARGGFDVTVLGSEDYLVGSFRRAVVAARDAALRLRAATESAADPPVAAPE